MGRLALVMADLAAGRDEAVPAEYARRLIAGESPLRVWRDRRGLSQSALARASGVNRVQIADIEAGRKKGSLETARRLAEALGLTVDDLISILPRPLKPTQNPARCPRQDDPGVAVDLRNAGRRIGRSRIARFDGIAIQIDVEPIPGVKRAELVVGRPGGRKVAVGRAPVIGVERLTGKQPGAEFVSHDGPHWARLFGRFGTASGKIA